MSAFHFSFGHLIRLVLIPFSLIGAVVFASIANARTETKEISLWQDSEGESCATTSARLLDRFVAVTGHSAFLVRYRENNSRTCRVVFRFKKERRESDNLITNFSTLVYPKIETEVFRFESFEQCLNSKRNLENFFQDGLEIDLISSACYSHDQRYFVLLLSAGPTSDKKLFHRDYGNISNQEIKRDQIKLLIDRIDVLHRLFFLKGDNLVYAATPAEQRKIERDMPRLENETKFLNNLTSPANLKFINSDDCETHAREYILPAFNRKIVKSLYDQSCKRISGNIFQYSLLFESKRRPNSALTWGWREVYNMTFESLNHCREYIEFSDLEYGFCSYIEGFGKYRAYQWES